MEGRRGRSAEPLGQSYGLVRADHGASRLMMIVLFFFFFLGTYFSRMNNISPLAVTKYSSFACWLGNIHPVDCLQARTFPTPSHDVMAGQQLPLLHLVQALQPVHSLPLPF